MAIAIQKGKSKLRPRARIIRTIGEELISNDIVAILELVKNSYDADARKVTINVEGDVFKKKDSKQRFPFVIPKGQGSITISDNGTGMTLDTIKNGWMEPATIIKKVKTKSGKGRRFLGEKGVGRFASARLSQSLEMITRVKDDNEVVAIFNWQDFSNDKTYLDEIDCTWEVRKPRVIKKQGTVLVLKNLNLDWDYEKLNNLRTALSRLINPVAPVRDFEIELVVPKEFSRISGTITSPASLGKPDYRIAGKIDNKGHAVMTYSSRKKNVTEEIRQKISLKPSREPLCGPFEFEFRVWDREQESMESLASEIGSTVKDIRRDLNEASGISVYRDGFRVLPYGEPKNDWLRLDMRRVQNPTLRLSNNQIVGYVAISLDNNPGMRDQSDREGIVESQSFNDFQEIIISILAELEIKRYHERPRKEEEKKEGIFSAISISPVIEMVEKKLPYDIEAKEILLETDKKIKEGVKKVQDVLARYRRLSTLGQLIDVVLHDGNGVLLKIDNEVQLLEKEFKKKTIDGPAIEKHLELIKKERKTLSELFGRLEPFSGRKRGRPKDIVLEKAINDVFALYSGEIQKLKASITLPQGETVVRIDEAEFEIIIVNLLQNSLYWLETVQGKPRRIIVTLSRNEEELILIFSDNGPGIKEEDVREIFAPYFSRKPDGIGLGLTIVGELVTEYGGTLELIDGGPLEGATFRITFTRRV
jgi:signal transduction histidine kinase